jgi:hypothetical protein
MNTRTTAHNKLVGGVVSLTFKASFRTHKSMAAATNRQTNKRTSSSENICRFQGKCTEKKTSPSQKYDNKTESDKMLLTHSKTQLSNRNSP